MNLSSEAMMEEYSVKSGWSNPVSAIDKLAPALVKAQGQIEGATKGKKNDHFRSKYADLGAVWDACRDALQANNLAVIQMPCKAPAGHIGLTTIILHGPSGQSLSETFYMPLKDASNPQAAGSALTYARRYALSAAIGICPVDDDGNAAAASPRAPKVEEPPTVDTAATVAAFREEWAKAKTPEEKKAVFMKARNSLVPEPEKTSLLTAFGNEMKGGKK